MTNELHYQIGVDNEYSLSWSEYPCILSAWRGSSSLATPLSVDINGPAMMKLLASHRLSRFGQSRAVVLAKKFC
jgi:hypothetical protein